MSELEVEDIRASHIPGAERSPLRHPSLPHVFDDPLAPLQESWIVRLGAVSIAPEGERGIEGQARLGLRLALYRVAPAPPKQQPY
jgi:hypothetical protein